MAIQVSQQSIVAHHTGRLSVSVSHLALIAHHASNTSVAVGMMGLVVHHTDEHRPVQIGALGVIAHHTDQHQPVQIASTAVIVHRSIGHFMKITPLEVEDEVDITGVRLKAMRGDMMRQAYFIVQLSHAHTKSVSVNYTTVPGTAIPPSEYQTQSGILTFAPGEVSKVVVIPIREADTDIDTDFTVLLTQPINASISDGVGLAEI